MGVCVPEELGGAGADFLSYILVLEELSRADAGVGVTVAVHTSAVTLPILAFGTHEQRQRFVPDLAAGRTLGAFALTEPDSGSDAGALRSTAVRRRRRLAARAARSSGSRTAATPARSSSSRAPTRPSPARAASAPSSSTAATIEVTREEEKLGPQLVVDGRHPLRRIVRRPRPAAARGEPRLQGRDGDARRRPHRHRRAGRRHRAGRLRRGAPATPLERRQFGSRIADFQAIQFKLADMATEIEAARRSSTGPPGSRRRGCRTRSRARRRSCSPRASRGGRRARRSRCSAGTATRRSSRSSATTATRR